jgi:glycosyltransferase involved in cell wall biosynthesis
MTETVSIIIPSYNYQGYIAAAVNSALAQTTPCEVIVVDDGSTDGSIDVLKLYGSRIKLILKDNAGETSAISMGFWASSGSVIVVLDSDDLLQPHCAETVLEHFAPGVSKVQYQLKTIDATGHSSGKLFPHYPVGLTPADVFEVNRTNGDYPSPPNTGNAFSREFLGQVLPIDDPRFQHFFDGYVNRLAPLYGTVVSLPQVLGSYRVHSQNYWARQDKFKMWRLYYQHDLDRQEIFERKARGLGIEVPADALRHNLRHIENRILAFRFDPTEAELTDPYYRVRLGCQALAAAAKAPNVSLIGRVVWGTYLPVLLVCPAELLRFVLVRTRASATKSNWVHNLVAVSKHGLFHASSRATKL